MAKARYQRTVLTGGGADSLDLIDGAGLNDGDFAVVCTSANIVYVYILDADSGLAESSPDRIVPDTSPGSKVWILQSVNAGAGTLYADHILESTTAHGVNIDSVLLKDGNVTGTSDTSADNTATAAIATGAFAKSQDAVLARDPDQGVALTAAAIAAMNVADSDQIDFGTGNFAVGGDFLIPDWTPAANQILIQKLTGGIGYQLEIVATTGLARLTLNATVYNSSVAPTAVDGTHHKIVAVVTVGAVNTLVDFYFDGVAIGTQQTAVNPGTVSSAAVFYILGTSAAKYVGTCFSIYILNFAPTAAEVLDMYRNGIPESWKWGSQTSLNVNTCVNYTYDTFDGASSTGFHAIANGGAYRIASTPDEIPVIANKTYLIEFDLALTSGTAPVVTIGSNTHLDAGWSSAILTINGHNSIILTADTTGTGVIGFMNNGTACEITVSNLRVVPAGTTLALTPESWQADKPYDCSSNNLTCAYPASGWSLTRPPAKKTMQPTPTDGSTGAVTVTIAMILNGIITGNPSAARDYTFETGETSDAWPSLIIDRGYEWSIINTNATNAITIVASSGHTIIGGAVVALSTTGRLLTRKTAAATFVTYRIA